MPAHAGKAERENGSGERKNSSGIKNPVVDGGNVVLKALQKKKRLNEWESAGFLLGRSQ